MTAPREHRGFVEQRGAVPAEAVHQRHAVAAWSGGEPAAQREAVVRAERDLLEGRQRGAGARRFAGGDQLAGRMQQRARDASPAVTRSLAGCNSERA